MVNVRIAQMGQTAVNRPFFEVVLNTKRYCFATAENGRVYFRNRAWMQSLGIYSSVCATFENSLTPDVINTLKLDSSGSVDRSERFAALTLGTGLGFVSDFTTNKGWAALYPSVSLPYNL